MTVPTNISETNDTKIRLNRDHHAFESASDFTLQLSCLAISTAVILGSDLPKRGENNAIGSHVLGWSILLPAAGAIEMAITDTSPNNIDVGFRHPKHPKFQSPSTELVHVSGQVPRLITKTINPIFVAFFEKYKPWLDANVSTDGANWPRPIDFGRVVRNACSHAGKLHMPSATSRPVEWRGLNYSHQNHRQTIIGPELIAGDILVLMLDMSDELAELGCPVHPE